MPSYDWRAATAGSMMISPASSPGDHAACDAEIARLRERAERDEATVDALYEYATTYRNDPGMALACDDILGIIGREQAQDRSDEKESP